MRSVLIGLGLVVGTIVLFVGGVWATMIWDERVNHDPVTARVQAVEPFCVMEYRRGRSEVWESGPMSCEEAARLDGRGDGNRMIRRMNLTVRYVSPVDGAEHESRFETIPELYPNVSPGDRIDILAHVREAGRTAEKVF